jgi:hypothetical protein
VCTRKRQREAQKQRYNNDPEWKERYRAYQKQYVLKKKGDPRWKLMQQERQAEHAKRNPKAGADKSKRWKENHTEFNLWRSAKQRAKEKGYEFTLSREWVSEHLAVGSCELTGIPFRKSDARGRCGPFHPSIDRIDSSKGYAPDNCRLILWALNMALSEWGEEVYSYVAVKYLEREQ